MRHRDHDDVSWRWAPSTSFGQLTGNPFSTRMRGHAEPQNFPPGMPQDEKPIQEPKRNRRNNEQVYRRDGISMIAKESLPALRRWPPSLCHVFCHGRLEDIDAKLEQLAVNPWRSPQRVSNAHLANEQ